MKNEAVRFCKDIGMFTIDRPRSTCLHATAFCRRTCFNNKLERAFGYVIHPKDIKNEVYWGNLTGTALRETLARKRNGTTRIRLMSRGEAFSRAEDVDRVLDLLVQNPDKLFWIPTRAWRNTQLRKMIEKQILPVQNARAHASLDPSNTEVEKESLISAGWRSMYYGDDNDTEGRFLCPKTHQHIVGACSTCAEGCFSDEQVYVHLKQH